LDRLGILVLAFIDSAGIPVASGMDALVIRGGGQERRRARCSRPRRWECWDR
jgi:hypothetical protein